MTRSDSFAADATLADVGEFGLIAALTGRFAQGPQVFVGPGDDAAIVSVPDGRTVLSIDTQVADQDFRLEWNNGYRTTGYDVGWKAAAQNLSDINAMGARATVFSSRATISS